MKKETIRIIFALVFMVSLALVAQFGDVKQAFIPEFAALTTGFWVQDKQIWRTNRVKAVILLTLTAIMSVVITNAASLSVEVFQGTTPKIIKVMSYSLTLRISLIFIFVSAMLIIMNATLTPVFAVGILGIMLYERDFLYPLVVFVLSIIIVTVQWVMDKKSLHTTEELKHTMRETWHNRTRWIFLLLFLLPLMVIGEGIDERFLVAPPLVVSFVEMSNSKGGFRFRLVQTWAMLVIAASIGVASRLSIIELCHAPIAVSVLLTMSMIFGMFYLFKKRFAPVAAMSLIPYIMPKENILIFPLLVAISVAYLFFVAHIFFIEKIKS